MLQLLVFIKLLLFGLLLDESYGNIEDEASKDLGKREATKVLKIFHAWLRFTAGVGRNEHRFWIFAKIRHGKRQREKPRQEHDAEFMNSLVAHKKERNEKSSFSGTFSPLCGCMGRQTFASLRLLFYLTGFECERTKFFSSSFFFGGLNLIIIAQ